MYGCLTHSFFFPSYAPNYLLNTHYLFYVVTMGRKVGIVTILEGGKFIWGFRTKCGGINRGGTPRVPKAPRGASRLIPTHEVGKSYKHEHGRKYWH